MATLFLLFVNFVFAATGVVFPAATTLTTTDGVSLAASWGIPAKATNGVVFVHMAGRAKEDWAPTAERLYRQGIAVVVFDLRGHGANVRGAPAPTLTDDEARKMPLDVKAAIAALASRGVKRVSLVGAELGANLAIAAAAEDPTVVSVILLSPGLVVRGVTALDAVKRYGARPILFVASNDDPYAARSAGVLDSAATGEHALEVYEAAGKGTRMLVREPTLEPMITGFVQRNWTSVPVAEGPTVNVQLGGTSLSTSGPTEVPVTP